MASYYEISKNTNGQFRFALKAPNGPIVLVSEQYKSKDSAKNGVASVQANCTLDKRYEKKGAKNGNFYFNLKAANHQVIGTSEMYTTETARDNGIAAVKANGIATTVKDITQ